MKKLDLPSNSLGNWAELAFMTAAAEHGFVVSRPHAATAPYDVIIEKDGHVWLVQVKCVTPRAFRHAFLVATNVRSCSPRRITRRPYRSNEIDFIAVLLPSWDLWYIIPVRAARTTTLYLRPEKPKYGRYPLERYRNNWHQLEPAGRKHKCLAKHALCRRFTLYRN